MAANYTRLIELKVKDDALKKATVRLFRSLERIEKKLDVIAGKGGKGFDAVAKGANRAAASFKKVEATTQTFARKSARLREGIAVLGLTVHGLSKALDLADAKLKATTGLWGFAAKKAQEATGSLVAWKASILAVAAAHPVLTGSVLAGVAAYTLFGSKTASVGKKLQQLTRGVYEAGAAVRKFVKSLKAPSGKGSELTIFDRIQSAKGGGLVGLRKLLDQVTAAQSKLISTNRGYVAQSEQVRAVEKALNAELMARKRIMDQIIISEQRRTPTSSLTAAAGQAGGLEGLRQLLAEAEGIQNRMLSTNENYKVASARVKNIQKAINQELRQRDLIMGKINIKEEKSVGLGERLRGIGAKLGSQAVQGARPGREIERRGLIAGSAGGLAGLGMFSNTAVGGALGTAGASAMGLTAKGLGLAGFGAAAKGITDSKVAMTGLVTAAKAAAGINVMNPAFIAALGVAWVAFGFKGIGGAIEKLIGAERAAKRTTASLFGFAKANPVLSRLNMKLEFSKDVVEKLGVAADNTSKKLAAVGKNKGTILQNTRASRASRSTSGFADWEASLRGTGTASARDIMIKSLERKNRRLVQLGQEKLKGDRLISKELRDQHKTAVKITKEYDKQQRAAKARLKNWKRIRAQKAENLMLGAGFPLLFGGGVGATAGGVGGALLGNALGLGGFGAQILGSALGTIIDTAVQKVVALQQALSQLNMDNLVESGIRLTGQLQAQIELAKRAGDHDRARALAANQIRKQTGLTQGTMGDINNAVNLLKAAWNDVSASVGGVLGILSAPFIVALSAILKLVSLAAQGFNTIAGALGNVLRLLPGSKALAKAFEGLNMNLQNSRKEAILLASAMNKIGDTAATRASIRGQKHRGLNLTYEQQRQNLGFDRDEMRMDFNAETRKQETAIKKKYPGILHNFLIGKLDAQRTGEFQLADQPFKEKAQDIDLREAESLRKLQTRNTMLNAQFEIEKKINLARKAGDMDTVARLGFESEKLSIQQKLGEDLRKAKSIEEEVLLVKNAILDIDRAREKVTGRISEAEQKLKATYAQMGVVIKDGMVDAIYSAIEGTKTLGETAASVFRQIAKMMINYGITAAFGKKGLGWLPGMAKGGPVTGDKSYIVGERGPELFTPKHSGRITPNHQLGGTNNVVVNVDASGGTGVTGDDAKAAELGRLLSNAVQDELVKQKRPGGILTR